jgi:hypothetical protein
MTNKMPKIRGFQNVWKDLQHAASDPNYDVTSWAVKVKLHGTNAGIRINSDGTVVAQKRSDDVEPGDHFGFGNYVEDLKGVINFPLLAQHYFYDFDDVTIMGEWAGPGIQKGVACSAIPEKTFFPFAILVNTKSYDGKHSMHYDSLEWHGFMEDVLSSKPKNFVPVDVLYKIHANARMQTAVNCLVDWCNDTTMEIEKEDPFIKEKFGVSGIGEGIVLYPNPYGVGYCPKHEFEALGFKVKGEEHAVNKAGKPARMKSNIPASAFEFADMHLTEARLEQGLQEVGGELVNENLGKFIGWICRDISTESALEIAESGLDWKSQLSGVIATRARNWFFEKQKVIA